ncbi:hypothetical protein SUGI_0239600 [Cryptomeria japonica]|nr:hypothetical protein SUGI_0239600 [Cryptomeria japonica]
MHSHCKDSNLTKKTIVLNGVQMHRALQLDDIILSYQQTGTYEPEYCSFEWLSSSVGKWLFLLDVKQSGSQHAEWAIELLNHI